VLKAIDFGVEKDLVRAHAVALEDVGKDVVSLVETRARSKFVDTQMGLRQPVPPPAPWPGKDLCLPFDAVGSILIRTFFRVVGFTGN
jgi:hypothetical protein